MHLISAPVPAVHTAPPDILRVRAVQRRASVSPSVARAISDIAFGEPDRDRVMILPALLSGSW